MFFKHRLNSSLQALILLSVLFLATQCIEDYDPDLSTSVNLLVVDGSIIQGEEQQSIVVSRSTSVKYPGFIPVEGCKVYVTDDANNVFRFNEETPGRYYAKIDSAYLGIGAKFKLTIETPGAQVYESSYEEIYDSPSMDSLYFIQVSGYSDQIHTNENGVRLNVDMFAKEEYNGYYRWKIHEYWESRSSNSIIEKMLVGVLDSFITTYKWDTVNSEYLRDKAIPIPEFEYFNHPDTFNVCYLDAELDDYFFSSTADIVTNSKKRVPLNFVPNGAKLSSRYGCVVSQYTLSENAYKYWQNKVSEIKESGGLYYTQPSQNLSNIKNRTNDQETVIGYFWVSERKQRKVIFEGPYLGDRGCTSQPFEIEDFYEMDPDSAFGKFRRIEFTYLPVYVTNDITGRPGCFDCRFSGGSLIQPDFWGF